MKDITAIKKLALSAIEAAADAAALEAARVRFLGRKGEVAAVLHSLKDLPLNERRRLGPQAQALKQELEAALQEKVSGFRFQVSERPIDLSSPGKRLARGHVHPLAQLDREIRRIFVGMNFSVVEGPEVENEHYNFDALNIPPDHPARDAWDTFWIKGTRQSTDPTERLLLRTHTSPMQVRYMETHEPPFQIIVPGRCFRYDASDAKHEINFDQLEGLMVGKNITLANFKFVVEEFFKKLFAGQRLEFRFRPSYFPFTEPSVEVDVKFKGKWLELMGAGMVNPRVFEYAHYNPRDWQGFAFGMGPDRLAMIKYQVPDMRLFFLDDLRFIHQF